MRVKRFVDRKLEAGGPLLERLLTGSFWNLVASVLNQGGSFVASVVAARILGRVGFGEYAIVLSTLMTIAVLAQTGLGFSATKYVAEFRSTDTERVGRILGLCRVLCPALALLFAVVLLVSAPWAARLFGSEALANPLAVGSVFVLFSTVNAYQYGVISGLERYRTLVAPAAACTLLTIAGVAFGAASGGVTGAIAGLSFGAAARWVFLQRVLTRESRRFGIVASFRGARRELPLLYGFAIPAALAGYVIMPGLWFANALLVHQPGGYAQMALYAAAQSVRLMALFVPQLVNSVGLSILNNTRRDQTAGNAGAARRMNLIAVTGITAVAVLALGVGGRPIMRLFGSDFAGGDDSVLLVLLASAVVESALMSLFQVIQAAGRMWFGLVAISLPWQAVFLVSAYFLVPRYGALGLAVSYLVGMSVALLATALAARSPERDSMAAINGGEQYVNS